MLFQDVGKAFIGSVIAIAIALPLLVKPVIDRVGEDPGAESEETPPAVPGP